MSLLMPHPSYVVSVGKEDELSVDWWDETLSEEKVSRSSQDGDGGRDGSRSLPGGSYNGLFPLS